MILYFEFSLPETHPPSLVHFSLVSELEFHGCESLKLNFGNHLFNFISVFILFQRQFRWKEKVNQIEKAHIQNDILSAIFIKNADVFSRVFSAIKIIIAFRSCNLLPSAFAKSPLDAFIHYIAKKTMLAILLVYRNWEE